MPGPVTVIVERPRGRWRDALRSYRIEVNGVAQGRVRAGGSLSLALPTGHYWVRAAIDWTGSPDVGINVVEGTVVHMVVEPAAGPFMAVAQVWGRGSYLNLAVVPG